MIEVSVAVIGLLSAVIVAMISRTDKRIKAIDSQVNNRPKNGPTVSEQIDTIATKVGTISTHLVRMEERQLIVHDRIDRIEAKYDADRDITDSRLDQLEQRSERNVPTSQ